MARIMDPVTYTLPNGHQMVYTPPYENLIWIGDRAVNYMDPKSPYTGLRVDDGWNPNPATRPRKVRGVRRVVPMAAHAKKPAVIDEEKSLEGGDDRGGVDAEPGSAAPQESATGGDADDLDPVDVITTKILTSTSARTRTLLIQSVLSGAYWEDQPKVPRDVRRRAHEAVCTYLSY